MAIEFNCPYCSAIIRVPDNAGGGKGKCPRCVRRITVPKVSSKSAPKPPDPEMEIFAAPDEGDDEITAVEPDTSTSDDVVFAAAESELDPAAPIDVFAPATRKLGELPVERPRQALSRDSISSKLKRKKQGGGLWIPVGFGLVLCGVIGWFAWQHFQSLQLSGELEAETASTLELPPAELTGTVFRQSPDEMKELLAELEKSPIRVPTSLMQIQISATKRAVTIRLNAGPHTVFYRVDVQGDLALSNYRKNQTLNLEHLREADLEQAASSFAHEYKRVLEKKAQPSALNDFRNTMALPALTRGLGHQVVAVQGQTTHFCVYEDHDGGLYFLLPADVSSFEIIGRKHKDGKVIFPGKYRVKVTGELKSPSEEKSEPLNKKKAKKIQPLDESKMEMKESMEDGEMMKGKDPNKGSP